MLYIVPTPLGNLKDLTFRALEALKDADIVFCEDTRRTLLLLNHYGLSKKLMRYNEHSGRSVEEALSMLKAGKKAALATDGGTPCISDPGRKLVAAARENGFQVLSLPGPSAVIAAAAGSGLPVDSFVFMGFLPRSPGRIRRELSTAFDTGRTVILYESPFRIKKLLALTADSFGPETAVVIARELTKIHEENLRGSLAELAEKLKDTQPRGEYVLIVAGKTRD